MLSDISVLPQLLVFNAMLNVVLLLLFQLCFWWCDPDRRCPLYPVFPARIFGADCGIWLHSNECRHSRRFIERVNRPFPFVTHGTLGLSDGRVIADGLRYALLIVLMIVVGTAAGFRFQNGPVPAIAGVALIDSLRYCSDLDGRIYRDIGQRIRRRPR